MTITYQRPRERVLFGTARDANPFLAAYESLWMLAGRNDVAGVAFYAKQFREYSDDGKTLHGAYGYRWRQHFGYDQLDWIVEELKANPYSRRCVLQMWDPGSIADGEAIEFSQDLYIATHGGKDVPCNLAVTFQIVGGWTHGDQKRLNMTVFNRSNDMIWGALGANQVHFGFLQEYLAARIGVDVGVYNQISSNLHVYSWNWKPEEWLAEYAEGWTDFYEQTSLKWPLIALSEDPKKFDVECAEIVERYSNDRATAGSYDCSFLRNVAQPLLMAWQYHKGRDYERALKAARCCWADDWRKAGVEWLERRAAKHAAKTTSTVQA